MRSSTMCLIQLPNRRAWNSRAISDRESTYCGFTSDATALIHRGRVVRADEDIPEAELSS